MKKLFGKTRRHRGAAMLIALLVFFLAALSGTLVLTMAASNAGRYTHEQEDQQAYLSVASAAKLIIGKLGATTVKFKSTRQSSPESAEEVRINNLSEVKARGLFFADENFLAMLRTFAFQPGGTVSDVAFTLRVPGAAEMGSVHVVIHVQSTAFFFRLYSTKGSSLDYQMSIMVTARSDGEGIGNFTQNTNVGDPDYGYFFRDLIFNTDNATFTTELLTGGEGA